MPITPSVLAHRYAGALVDVVTAPSATGDPRQIVAQLQDFEGVLSGSTELRNALSAPSVPASRKRAVVGRIADRLSLARTTRNFLFILADHRRLAELAEVVQAFEIQLDERLGFARAEVTAAQDLDEGQRAALVQDLEKLTQKRVRLLFSVDPALIGGVVARIGSTVYDGSVRGRLESLGRRLAAE